MRARIATLAALCVAGALATATTLPGGAASAAATSRAASAASVGSSRPASPPAASDRHRAWLLPTPTYWPLVVGQQASQPQAITRGVDWNTQTYQTVGGAQQAQVMNVDLTDPNVRLGAVEAGNKLVDPADETISSMAGRTGAVAGVNADFFDINASGQPLGMVVQNGVLEASPVSSWPDDLEVLGNGQVKIATETFAGTAADTTAGSSQPLAAVNRTDRRAWSR